MRPAERGPYRVVECRVGDEVELSADAIPLEVIQLGHAFRAVAGQQSRAHGVPIDSSVKIRGKQ
jgi:hypothetical protein